MNVSTIRHALGLTQRQLAETMDATLSSIKKWETGRTPVPESRQLQLRLLVDWAKKQMEDES